MIKSKNIFHLFIKGIERNFQREITLCYSETVASPEEVMGLRLCIECVLFCTNIFLHISKLYIINKKHYLSCT